jgi:hypothetical protein
MDTIKATSASAPFLVGPEVNEEKRGGTTTTYTYTGTLAQCQARRAIDRASGASTISLAPSGDGLWRLSVTYAGLPQEEGGSASDPAVNLHELDVQPEQIAIWESDRLRTFLSTEADVALVRRAVGMFLSNSPLYSGGTLIQNPTKTQYIDAMKAETTNDTDSEAVFNRVAAQGDFTTVFRSTYRRSITAASYNQVRAAYTGAGKIWTSGEVESFEGIPTSEWFGLPSAQWLKAPPRVSAAYGGKTEIQYYYSEIVRPSKYYYAAYNSATLVDA